MGEYREYLRIPGVKPLLLVSTFGRLAYAMVSLAIFFQVQSVTGSVATAGLAVGLSGLAGALTAGPRGHLVDRFGQTRPLYAFVPGVRRQLPAARLAGARCRDRGPAERPDRA